MPIQHHSRPTWTKRLILIVGAFVAMLGLTVIATPAANATVFSSCNISGCANARTANSIWQSKGYPSQRGWYSWPNGQCNFAGGTYFNNDGQLPAGDSFQEFDTNPRACGAHRDAARIVLDVDTGAVWYTPDHYSNFYHL